MPSISEKAFVKGAEFPPLADGVLRLYSMRLCPYAQRTRLVLAYKNIEHETININLRSKPDWFLERNPVGKVPTLEQDGKVVYESAICDNYLDDVYLQKKLTPSDPYVKARHNILMDLFGQVTSLLYKYRGVSDEEKPAVAEDIKKSLQPFEDALEGKFFGGEDPAMVDFHIWPWFERMGAFEGKENSIISTEKFPKVVAWVDTMMSLPAVRNTFSDVETHKKYLASMMSGTADYDVGLST